jgi:carbonic anhydrase
LPWPPPAGLPWPATTTAPVTPKPYTAGATLTKSVQASITPDKALEILKAGNTRFAANKPLRRNLKAQVQTTALGQFPFASVVGCIDSRRHRTGVRSGRG